MNLNGPIALTNQLDLFADTRERERALRAVAAALIERLRIQESALIALRLAPRPSRNTREAVVAFVTSESVALATGEIRRAFPVLEQRLADRIEDLFGA